MRPKILFVGDFCEKAMSRITTATHAVSAEAIFSTHAGAVNSVNKENLSHIVIGGFANGSKNGSSRCWKKLEKKFGKEIKITLADFDPIVKKKRCSIKISEEIFRDCISLSDFFGTDGIQKLL